MNSLTFLNAIAACRTEEKPSCYFFFLCHLFVMLLSTYMFCTFQMTILDASLYIYGQTLKSRRKLLASLLCNKN